MRAGLGGYTRPEILLRQARSVTVTLLGEPDSAEEMFQVSLRTRDQLTRLADQAGCPWEVETLTGRDASALGHLERCFFGEGEPWQGDSGAIRIREADTAFSEVEQTAAEICKTVSSHWERLAQQCGLSRGAMEYMRPAFSLQI